MENYIPMLNAIFVTSLMIVWMSVRIIDLTQNGYGQFKECELTSPVEWAGYKIEHIYREKPDRLLKANVNFILLLKNAALNFISFCLISLNIFSLLKIVQQLKNKHKIWVKYHLKSSYWSFRLRNWSISVIYWLDSIFFSYSILW